MSSFLGNSSPPGSIGTIANDGTANAPGLAFTNDPNLGLYRIGADKMGVSIGANGLGLEVGNFTTTNLDPISPAILRYSIRTYPQPIAGVNETAALYLKIDPSGADHQISGMYAEITNAQLDTYGPAIKIIHSGAGDGMYVAQFQSGGAGYENATFTDGTKGFISTMQAAACPNSVLFNALWQQDAVPNFGMFYADDAPGNALTIKKWTSASDGQAQIRLIERDVTNRQRFGVYNSGELRLSSLDTTVGSQTANSPPIRVLGARWSGSSSQDIGGYMQYAYDVPGNTGGGSGLRFYIGDLGSESIAFIARSTGFDLNGNSVTNAASISGTLVNLQTSGTQFDHYVNGNVHYELAAPADGETAILVRRNLGNVLSLQRVSMGAIDSAGQGYRVLRVPN